LKKPLVAGVAGTETLEDPELEAVEAHYSRANLDAAIRMALRAAGKNLNALTPDDLGALDQFHLGGKEATVALAHVAALRPGLTVLDMGGGLGGPARILGRDFGCTVTVLDPTAAYCRIGTWLTARTGLSNRVAFVRGSGTAAPFADDAFDVVWTQHSGMNIADKERLYREIRRVLRPGGCLALEEIMTGSRIPVRFPVPWASDQSLSFLKPPTAIRQLLAELGFTERSWADITASVLATITTPVQSSAAATPSPLGVHVLLGANAEQELGNLVCNVMEGRIAVVRAVLSHG
jgi:SAM-dependent methyltransferase